MKILKWSISSFGNTMQVCAKHPRSTSLSNMIKTKDDKGWMNTFYVSWANETERGSL